MSLKDVSFFAVFDTLVLLRDASVIPFFIAVMRGSSSVSSAAAELLPAFLELSLEIWVAGMYGLGSSSRVRVASSRVKSAIADAVCWCSGVKVGVSDSSVAARQRQDLIQCQTRTG